MVNLFEKKDEKRSEHMRKVIVNQVDPNCENFGFITLMYAKLNQLETNKK